MEQMETRLALAHMALQIAINPIVFTDEMWVEFGKPRRQWNVSRYPGVDRNTYAIHNKDTEKRPIRLMFWGAIIQGFKGPCHVWEEDSVKDKRHFQEIMNEKNQIRHQRQEFNQQQAQVPTSWQYEALTNLNSMIENLNKEEGRSGRHKRRKRKAEQTFKEKELEFTSKEDINWVSYQERVLRPKLYPWMESLQKTLGVPYLYLVKDNAPSHQTTRRIDEDERLSHGILTLKWPSKSLPI